MDARGSFSSALFRAAMERTSLLAAFILGFWIVAVAINLSSPPAFLRHAAERSEKLALIDGWRGRATSAAFGTSRVHNGFSPAAFDVGFADAPYAVTGLNLGLYGGSQTEQRALAHEFLARLEPPSGRNSVCLVMLELNAGVNFQLVNLLHPRSIDVYDLDTIRFVASFSDHTVSVPRRIGRLAFALISGALHLANIGALSSTWFDPPAPSNTIAPDQRGMLPVPAGEDGARAVADAFRQRSNPPTRVDIPLLPGNRSLLADLAAATRVSNVQFVYFVLPSLEALASVPVYPPSLDGPNGPVPIINLARPDRYPELFRPEAWANPGHLSAIGAELATRLLAREVRAWLSNRPSLPICGN
jgi:hypothetical protein